MKNLKDFLLANFSNKISLNSPLILSRNTSMSVPLFRHCIGMVEKRFQLKIVYQRRDAVSSNR